MPENNDILVNEEIKEDVNEDKKNNTSSEDSSKDEAKKDDSQKEDSKAKTFTQEELNNIVKARIEKEKDKYEKIVEELQNANDSAKEGLIELENYKEENSKLSRENLIYSVSLETGLDIDVIETLKGDTKDELLESVNKIHSSFEKTSSEKGKNFDIKRKRGEVKLLAPEDTSTDSLEEYFKKRAF